MGRGDYELQVSDGTCRLAGVPPESCPSGFTAADASCAPRLPAEPCSSGFLAVPGDESCREVALCGEGVYGSIPVDITTEHVDGGNLGGSSDGTAAHPWRTIQEAIDAADPLDVIAVAAGSYPEDLVIEGKAVRLWGICPSRVEIVGSEAAMFLRPGATGSEVRRLAVTGGEREFWCQARRASSSRTCGSTIRAAVGSAWSLL